MHTLPTSFPSTYRVDWVRHPLYCPWFFHGQMVEVWLLSYLHSTDCACVRIGRSRSGHYLNMGNFIVPYQLMFESLYWFKCILWNTRSSTHLFKDESLLGSLCYPHLRVVSLLKSGTTLYEPTHLTLPVASCCVHAFLVNPIRSTAHSNSV